MFENPEKKLKTFAKVLLWIVAIGCIALAFLLGWADVSQEVYLSSGWKTITKREFQPGIFFGLLIGGPIDAYILSLFLYVIADMAETAKETKRFMQDMKQTLTLGLNKNIRETVEEQEKVAAETRQKEREEREKQWKKEQERRERERTAEQSRKQRIEEYWAAHSEEKQALVAKKAEAEMKLKQLGALAGEEKKTIQEIIRKIDFELTRDR